ncbi:MAG: hypothetical protein IPM21_16150 [Acidobacteria bacterium]|nr:hypothetical protein [Acidobacteriota bacterium]
MKQTRQARRVKVVKRRDRPLMPGYSAAQAESRTARAISDERTSIVAAWISEREQIQRNEEARSRNVIEAWRMADGE